ncbi:MAG: tryptophan--tRNA ligase [Candidatus Caldatribacteriota bacterium]|nr:tryptophan--tRNA ligase [Candidatus Caldatribacteriota bacterium]
MKGIIFSGMRPTGKLHLGNYLGALENWVKLQKEYKCFFGVVDYHALTTGYKQTDELNENIQEMLMDWLSAGINPEKSTVLIQSYVPEHAELHLLFSMITPLSWLERNPVLKEQVRDLELKENINYGLLGYPVLMASDILIYKSNAVPVGEDQVHHIELSREIARKFNGLYKNVFPLPQVKLTETPRVPGIDGNRMSKSLKNTISISDLPKTIEEKVKLMITDTQKIKLKDPGHPDICPVFNYQKIFNQSQCKEIFKGCKSGKLGCVECKKILAKVLIDKFDGFRKKRRYFEKNPKLIQEIVIEGSKKAREVAKKTLEEVKEAMKMHYE